MADNDDADAGDKVSKASQAALALVKEVPVYKDALQPGMQEIGKALKTVGQTLNSCLMPLRVVIWCFDKIEEFLVCDLRKKLAEVPPERLQPPDPHVAGPAVEALRFVEGNPDLRDMFSSLIATAIDSSTSHTAHPGFVDIIKNLSADDAKILRVLVVNDHPYPLADVQHYSGVSRGTVGDALAKVSSGFSYLKRNVTTLGEEAGLGSPRMATFAVGNLNRLGLVKIDEAAFVASDAYAQVARIAGLERLRKQYEGRASVQLERKSLELTDFGRLFCAACVLTRTELAAKRDAERAEP